MFCTLLTHTNSNKKESDVHVVVGEKIFFNILQKFPNMRYFTGEFVQTEEYIIYIYVENSAVCVMGKRCCFEFTLLRKNF